MDNDFTSEISTAESILLSTKKMLGLSNDNDVFDLEIILNINSAIMNLRQLGVPIKKGYSVASKYDTYLDMLGELINYYPDIPMYLYYRTKLSFDPPESPKAVESIKKLSEECECRISYYVDPPNTFEEVKE